MKFIAELVVFLCALNQEQVSVSGADIKCVPGRCDPAPFNRKRDVTGKGPSGPPSSDVPKSKSPELRKTLDHFVRYNNEPADLFRAPEKGIANVYSVVLFNEDKEGKESFQEKYKKFIISKMPLSDTTMYVIQADERTLRAVCEERIVAFIEQDSQVEPAACGSQTLVDYAVLKWKSSWGLSRIDENSTTPDHFYKYDVTPEQGEVYVYVMDTGIKPNSAEYGSRLAGAVDVSGANNALDDIHGHGTHVAGTVASSTYGVAKQVKVFAVRLSSDVNGTSTSTKVIQAFQGIIDHVAANNKKNKAVINISFGGPSFRAENLKANEVVSKGITVVTSAGNKGKDACCQSPASANGVITVGCTQWGNNEFCSFSNWGICVDIQAPGRRINSLGLAGELVSMSGTSMASPHVAGAAAILIARNMATGGLSPAQVKSQLLSTANTGIVTKIKHPHITTDKLLYVNCTG